MDWALDLVEFKTLDIPKSPSLMIPLLVKNMF
jgi:hypothetical protein